MGQTAERLGEYVFLIGGGEVVAIAGARGGFGGTAPGEQQAAIAVARQRMEAGQAGLPLLLQRLGLAKQRLGPAKRAGSIEREGLGGARAHALEGIAGAVRQVHGLPGRRNRALVAGNPPNGKQQLAEIASFAGGALPVLLRGVQRNRGAHGRGGVLKPPGRTQAEHGTVQHQRAAAGRKPGRGSGKRRREEVRNHAQLLAVKTGLVRREGLVATREARPIDLGEGLVLPLRRASVGDGREQRRHGLLVIRQEALQSDVPLRPAN